MGQAVDVGIVGQGVVTGVEIVGQGVVSGVGPVGQGVVAEDELLTAGGSPYKQMQIEQSENAKNSAVKELYMK